MAQEFYIDENGNKIPISGTVTSADMLPLTAGSSKMTSEAINEVDGNKPTNTAGSPFLKIKTTANINKSITASGYVTITGSDIDLAETGYTPIALTSFYNTQVASCYFGSVDVRVVSGSGTFAIVKNVSASNLNCIMNFTILFMRTTN